MKEIDYLVDLGANGTIILKMDNKSLVWKRMVGII
jgi:hypothetical protein